MTLRRLILTIKPDGHELRVLYRTASGSGPSTKKRQGEVVELARSGLTAALEALDAGDVTDLGTSGFSVREDVLGLNPLQREGTPTPGGIPQECEGYSKSRGDVSGLRTASSDTQKPMRKGA